MTHLELAVDIQAPAQRVWDAVTSWEQQGKWMMATSVKSLDGTGQAQGARIEAITGIGRFGVLDTMTITAWDPPKFCSVLHDSPGLPMGDSAVIGKIRQFSRIRAYLGISLARLSLG
ncbi:MAG: SRPBCC family protein [Actinobacteria bacterium]|nr:SRPBCC family protein [Actinomycetota bacterium]